MWRWLAVGDGSSTVADHRASVTSDDQKGEDREGKVPANDGGEDEVLGRNGGATGRPGHVHRIAAMHGSPRRSPCPGQATTS
jgi:hypothetical protein